MSSAPVTSVTHASVSPAPGEQTRKALPGVMKPWARASVLSKVGEAEL